MHWFTAFLCYVMVWWVVLFAVLPFGVRPETEPDAATGWRGAPRRPQIGIKLLAATLIAALIWAAIMAVISSNLWSFRA